MKIAIASDHAGFSLKEDVKKHLQEFGHEYKDFGTYSEDSVDYPDYASLVCNSISENMFERGILICGTGIGMSIAANKFPGIMAALCYDAESAKLSREHNDSNVLVLGGRITNSDVARDIVSSWLDTKFSGDRHMRRVNKIKDIEQKMRKL